MPKVALYNIAGETIGEQELSENVFGAEINVPAMHQVVVAYLANQRQGTQSALTRGEVRGGGRKIYRQKGTGNARHHSNRAPIFAHGGMAFAPKPRDYRQSVNRKMKRVALKSALSGKVNDSEVIVFDALDIAAAKTKEMVKTLNAVKAKKALIVLPESDEIVERAAHNIPGIKTTLVGTLNVYEILKYDMLILTKDAVAKIEEVYA